VREVVETCNGHASLDATPEGGDCSLTLPMSPSCFERACNLISNVTVTVFLTTGTGDIVRLYSAALLDADWDTLFMDSCPLALWRHYPPSHFTTASVCCV
jgi:hypothetical protein